MRLFSTTLLLAATIVLDCAPLKYEFKGEGDPYTAAGLVKNLFIYQLTSGSSGYFNGCTRGVSSNSMTIDGADADWTGANPAITDATGDSSGGAGTDISDVKVSVDPTYLYILVLTNGVTPTSGFNVNVFAPGATSGQSAYISPGTSVPVGCGTGGLSNTITNTGLEARVPLASCFSSISNRISLMSVGGTNDHANTDCALIW